MYVFLPVLFSCSSSLQSLSKNMTLTKKALVFTNESNWWNLVKDIQILKAPQAHAWNMKSVELWPNDKHAQMLKFLHIYSSYSIRILKDSTNVSDIEDGKHRFWLYLHMHWKCPITVNGEWNVIQEAVHSYINFHLITCTLYSIYSTHPTRQHYILGDVKPFKIAFITQGSMIGLLVFGMFQFII